MNRFLISAVVLIIALTAVANAEAQKSVKAFGSYRNVYSDGEHESGYSLDLWSYGGKLIGIIRVHRGLVGDAPAGMLDDVAYSRSTHKLSFRSKVTIGLFSDLTHKEVPSQDLVTVTGVLTRARLSGRVVIVNKLCDKGCRESHHVVLRRERQQTSYLKNFRNYDAWKESVKIILDTYGPQW